MSAREAVAALPHGYGLALDSRDEVAFASLWTPDGVLDVFGDGPQRAPTGSVRAERGFAIVFERLARYARTMHHVTTQAADASGPTATGVVYCEAHHLRETPDEDVFDDLVMYIRYVDRYAIERETWRFAHRRVEVLFTEQRLVRATR